MQEYRDAEERQRIAYEMKQRKCSYREIGEALGVAPKTVAYQIKMYERRAKLPDWVAGLDLATAEALIRAGITSKRELRSALASKAPIPRIKEIRRALIEEWLAGGTGKVRNKKNWIEKIEHSAHIGAGVHLTPQEVVEIRQQLRRWGMLADAKQRSRR